MAKPKPRCQSLHPWLRENLGKHCLGALTSTDSAALDAAVHLIQLYNQTGDENVLPAFAMCVRIMHRDEVRRFAYHAIAHVMDWHCREDVWRQAGLEQLPNPGVCAYEPNGHRRHELYEKS